MLVEKERFDFFPVRKHLELSVAASSYTFSVNFWKTSSSV